MPHVDSNAGLHCEPAADPGAAADAIAGAALTSLVRGQADPMRPALAALRRTPRHPALLAFVATAAVVTDRAADRAHARAAARALEGIGDAPPRHRAHAAAALAWLDGCSEIARSRYAAIVSSHPQDLLALRAAHALDFRAGDRAMLRDRAAGALARWDARSPDYGDALALHAFGLEECGDYAAAVSVAEAARACVPDSPVPLHVLAHVCEMQGRTAEGIALLESTRHVWLGADGYRAHLAWHLALFHTDRGETGRALALYDTLLAPGPDSGSATLVDASALLWRLTLRGAAAGARWRALAGAWSAQRLAGSRLFNVVHAVLAFAGAGALRRARQAAALLRHDRRASSPHPADDLALALALSEGVIAFAAGRYGEAVDRITAVRELADRCGGSVAQCDLIHLTLIEAALRAQRDRLARALARERCARKPASGINQWLSARASAIAA